MQWLWRARPVRQAIRTLAVAAAVSAPVAGLAGASNQISLPAAARQYLAAVTPLDQTAQKVAQVLSSQPVNSWPRFQAIARPYLAALARFDRTVSRVPWPSSVLPDVRSLLAADQRLRALLAVRAGSIPAVNSASGVVTARGAAVRRDLGLPQAASTTSSEAN